MGDPLGVLGSLVDIVGAFQKSNDILPSDIRPPEQDDSEARKNEQETVLGDIAATLSKRQVDRK